MLSSTADLSSGSEVIASIRPECIQISTAQPAGTENVWTGEVLTRAFLGDSVDHVVGVGKHEIRVRCNPSVSIAPGTSVYLQMETDNLSLVPVG